MRASDILLSMEGEHLDVWKSKYDNSIYVDYQQGEVKEGPVLIGVFGSGSTLEEACESYLEKIRGKPLVFHACTSQRYEARIVDTGVSTSTLMQNQPQSQRWISVDNELPEFYEWVLVAGAIQAGTTWMATAYRNRLIDGGWYWWWFGYPAEIGDVTHWMPLPDPPKVD